MEHGACGINDIIPSETATSWKTSEKKDEFAPFCRERDPLFYWSELEEVVSIQLSPVLFTGSSTFLPRQESVAKRKGINPLKKIIPQNAETLSRPKLDGWTAERTSRSPPLRNDQFLFSGLQHTAEDRVLAIQTSADATILAQRGRFRAPSDDLKTQKVILVLKKKML